MGCHAGAQIGGAVLDELNGAGAGCLEMFERSCQGREAILRPGCFGSGDFTGAVGAAGTDSGLANFVARGGSDRLRGFDLAEQVSFDNGDMFDALQDGPPFGSGRTRGGFLGDSFEGLEQRRTAAFQ